MFHSISDVYLYSGDQGIRGLGVLTEPTIEKRKDLTVKYFNELADKLPLQAYNSGTMPRSSMVYCALCNRHVSHKGSSEGMPLRFYHPSLYEMMRLFYGIYIEKDHVVCPACQYILCLAAVYAENGFSRLFNLSSVSSNRKSYRRKPITFKHLGRSALPFNVRILAKRRSYLLFLQFPLTSGNTLLGDFSAFSLKRNVSVVSLKFWPAYQKLKCTEKQLYVQRWLADAGLFMNQRVEKGKIIVECCGENICLTDAHRRQEQYRQFLN